MNVLIVIDIQNDFLPGGALAVQSGDTIIAPVNALMRKYDLVVATQDWHPANHGSFAPNHPGNAVGETIELAGMQQILWPAHCVRGTRGAEIAGSIESGRFDAVFRKGCDPEVDSYSGFFDNQRRQDTGLADWLSSRDIAEIGIVGLALDDCVKFTALDAIDLGLRAYLHTQACRAVNLEAEDDERAIAELQAAGVRIIDPQPMHRSPSDRLRLARTTSTAGTTSTQ